MSVSSDNELNPRSMLQNDVRVAISNKHKLKCIKLCLKHRLFYGNEDWWRVIDREVERKRPNILGPLSAKAIVDGLIYASNKQELPRPLEEAVRKWIIFKDEYTQKEDSRVKTHLPVSRERYSTTSTTDLKDIKSAMVFMKQTIEYIKQRFETDLEEAIQRKLCFEPIDGWSCSNVGC